MEHVALNNVQLDYLARDVPRLKRYFYWTVACDRLPKSPVKTQPQGYIVNTDPHDQPGQHWLAVWTDGNVCEGPRQLCLAHGNVRASHPVASVDRDPLEVCGDEWQGPTSHLKQVLWRLRVVVLESQSPWTYLARVFK